MNIEDTHLLQSDINAISEWANTWLMRFNVSKCCCVQFTEAKIHRIDNTYYLNETPLIFSDYCKYLGVTLQSNLKWDKHIEEKTANANQTLGILKRNIKSPAHNIRELAYKALVRPKLEYASIVWSPWQVYLINSIEKVQRRAARYVYNDYRSDSSVTSMISKLYWESLETRRTKAGLIMFYKMFNGIANIPFNQYIQLSTLNSTRHSHQFKLIPMYCKKNASKFSFLSRTTPVWNQLPEEIISCNSLDSFKYKLDHYNHL